MSRAERVAADRGVSPVLRGAGRPLAPATRSFMEPRFGRDFSHVRVHADREAGASAASMGARAYTVGHAIVFGPGRYAPGTGMGDRLLAHELAHVVQQERPVGVGRADAAAEGRAGRAADVVTRGGVASPDMVGRASLGIAAEEDKDPPSLRSTAAPLGGRLRISAQLVADLRARGLLDPKLAALIASGQILLDTDPTSMPSTVNIRPPFVGPGSTLPPASASPASPTQGWVPKLAPSIKASFSLFDGLTIGDLSPGGITTTVGVSGVTQKLFSTKGGTAGQVELGWGKKVGLQISHGGWFAHGEVDTDGACSFSLSFPSDSPLPVLPWLDGTFQQGAGALKALTQIAASGETDPAAIVRLVKPHIDGMKNAIDAGKGIAGAGPRLSGSLVVGSGPPPGSASGGASGIYVGGALVFSF